MTNRPGSSTLPPPSSGPFLFLHWPFLFFSRVSTDNGAIIVNDWEFHTHPYDRLQLRFSCFAGIEWKLTSSSNHILTIAPWKNHQASSITTRDRHLVLHVL